MSEGLLKRQPQGIGKAASSMCRQLLAQPDAREIGSKNMFLITIIFYCINQDEEDVFSCTTT
jgi:hypothetical protein